MYKLFLTLRYLLRRRIAYFAVAAVTLCTAMVLIVMSVMGGFLDQLKTKARGLLGDIIVDNRSYSGFPLYEEYIAEISKWPEVVKATPVLYSFGLLRFSGTDQTHTVRVVGIRLEETYIVNAFKAGLFYERYYPGTTTLAEQREPQIGIDTQGPPIMILGEDGRELGPGARPLLPEPYQSALEKSWKAGVVDTESPDNQWTQICERAGLPPIVGEYVIVDPLGPPALTGEPWPGVILGRDIIAKRLADGRYQRYAIFPRGCPVSLTLVPVSGAGTVDTPIKQPLRYADDSRTGIYEIDSQHVYLDFDLLQKLLMMQATDRVNPETGEVLGQTRARCSQIQVKIQSGVDPRALAKRLQERYRAFLDDPHFAFTWREASMIDSIDVLTWEESQAHIIAPVEKERQLVTILFAIISLVAAVLVLCILYMIVLQKTRDIGIIKSIGGSSSGVAAIFVTYGAAVGTVGAALGSVGGYVFVHYINKIQDWLRSINPAWQVWSPEVYSFDEIPHTVRSEDIVTVIVAAIAASTLGALAAAWRAGAMQPVEALRHE